MPGQVAPLPAPLYEVKYGRQMGGNDTQIGLTNETTPTSAMQSKIPTLLSQGDISYNSKRQFCVDGSSQGPPTTTLMATLKK